jgi:hypothetical protein
MMMMAFYSREANMYTVPFFLFYDSMYASNNMISLHEKLIRENFIGGEKRKWMNIIG